LLFGQISIGDEFKRRDGAQRPTRGVASARRRMQTLEAIFECPAHNQQVLDSVGRKTVIALRDANMKPTVAVTLHPIRLTYYSLYRAHLLQRLV
jgi:hypothetical protein